MILVYKKLRHQNFESVNIIATQGTRFMDMCILDSFQTVFISSHRHFIALTLPFANAKRDVRPSERFACTE
jgi:hypothetical protein